MDREQIVFCIDLLEYGEEGFRRFTHEADYFLISLTGQVKEGKMTPAEALDAWEPYRDVYDPKEEKRELEADIDLLREQGDHDFAQELEQELREGKYDFPDYDAVVEDPFIVQTFKEEAYELANELDIPGVGYFGVSMSTGPIFSVETTEALEELQKAMSGKYKIVVKKDLDELFPYPPPSPEEAMEFIQQARD